MEVLWIRLRKIRRGCLGWGNIGGLGSRCCGVVSSKVFSKGDQPEVRWPSGMQME